MKTFKDLKFLPHEICKELEKTNSPLLKAMYRGATHANMTFENGYEVLVLFGKPFYSNGVDTYELAILKDGSICYDTDITDDVMSYLTEQEVTDVMLKTQKL
jgi:hypothetical protein